MRAHMVRLAVALSMMTLVILLPGTVALAHHSFEAEYDSTKIADITGFVTKLDWQNPHAYVFIDSKDDSGAVKNYRVEMGPPYALVRGGWKRDTLKIGDKVTVSGAALAKDGGLTAGSMQTTMMNLADGKKLVMR
jgi:uncharacterized protein DUF6152